MLGLGKQSRGKLNRKKEHLIAKLYLSSVPKALYAMYHDINSTDSILSQRLEATSLQSQILQISCKEIIQTQTFT